MDLFHHYAVKITLSDVFLHQYGGKENKRIQFQLVQAIAPALHLHYITLLAWGS